MQTPRIQCPMCPERWHTPEALAEHLYDRHSDQDVAEQMCAGQAVDEPCPLPSRFVIDNGHKKIGACGIHLAALSEAAFRRRGSLGLRRAGVR